MNDHQRPGAPSHSGARPSRLAGVAVWLPGLIVALGAAVATVHGIYEVAVVAGVPAAIAWLYPLITDGLALVAYSATARLSGTARRYAWFVVALAAGLSGLAQATYLANTGTAGDAELPVDPALRFGVGAWPAVAAAIVAHLLFLLAVDEHTSAQAPMNERATVHPQPGGAEHPAAEHQPFNPRAVSEIAVVQRPDPGPVRQRAAALNTGPTDRTVVTRAAVSPARDRARSAAATYVRDHDRFPTVSELEDLAEVSRGTAAAALKDLRT